MEKQWLFYVDVIVGEKGVLDAELIVLAKCSFFSRTNMCELPEL